MAAILPVLITGIIARYACMERALKMIWSILASCIESFCLQCLLEKAIGIVHIICSEMLSPCKNIINAVIQLGLPVSG